MSHFTRPSTTNARRYYRTESTMKITACWGCAAELVMHRHGKTKICKECRERMSATEIRDLINQHFKHTREMFAAKHSGNPPANKRYIFNSPFNKA